MLLEGVLEIGQRRERPLAGPAGRVHQAVEHLEPVVAHPQGIGVGERQADGPARGPVVLDDAVQLAADVLARGPDVGQDPRNDRVFQFLIQHERVHSGDNPARARRRAVRHLSGLRSMGRHLDGDRHDLAARSPYTRPS